MIRLILRLLRIRDFEVCASCETLKQQLAYERSEKTQLIDTILRIVNPKTIEAAAPIEMNQIASSSALFSRRRAALEEKDRQEAQIIKNSKNIGKPDIESLKAINDLEKELLSNDAE